jgi:hypothetical protein
VSCTTRTSPLASRFAKSSRSNGWPSSHAFVVTWPKIVRRPVVADAAFVGGLGGSFKRFGVAGSPVAQCILAGALALFAAFVGTFAVFRRG